MESCPLWLIAFLVSIPLSLCCVCTRIFLTFKARKKLRTWLSSESYLTPPTQRTFVVGFFHPYCNAGGGGERVLWHAVDALQKRYDFVHIVVYTGDVGATEDQILDRVVERFDIQLSRQRVHFVYLRSRRLVEASCWPRLTILFQSLGSCVLGLEALFAFVPHLYIDSMGYAFTVPLFKYIGGCRTASYVHYPTVSTDMIQLVESSVTTYNNSSRYAKSRIWRKIKVWYYKMFAKIYGFVGRRNQVVMVNSSWTYQHIKTLWGPSKLTVLYPPCDTRKFLSLPLEPKDKEPFLIVSIGQFRPEKRQQLQFEVIRNLRSVFTSADWRRMKLILIGGCRNREDEERVEWLKEEARKLKVLDQVEFKLNISFSELREIVGKATVGLHTMWNEHFGIGVVELMASGAIIVADDSGGPRMDIIKDWEGQAVGYLATTAGEYAKAIEEIYKMKWEQQVKIATAARAAVDERFSVEAFQKGFLRATECLFTS